MHQLHVAFTYLNFPDTQQQSRDVMHLAHELKNIADKFAIGRTHL